jgi:hypothetical protein
LIERNAMTVRRRMLEFMSPTSIARSHLAAALAEAEASGANADALARAMLSQVIAKFLEYRSVADVKAELLAAAENCDPDTDYPFMRP